MQILVEQNCRCEFMNEFNRTPNANKLFNRVLECESELKELYKAGFKLASLSSGVDSFFRTRSKLRFTYERLLIEEAEFSLKNGFHLKLWEDCYEKPVEWIQKHLDALKPDDPANTIQLRKLRSILLSIFDEGSSFFLLILRFPSLLPEFRYHFVIYAAVLLRKRKECSTNNQKARAFSLLQEAITTDPFEGLGYFVLAQWSHFEGDLLLSMYWALIASNALKSSQISDKAVEFVKSLAKIIAASPSFPKRPSSEDFTPDFNSSQLLQMASHALLSQLTGTSHLKHLDQLSHSRLQPNYDSKSLKYACSILWILLGMKTIYGHSNGEVSLVQSCLLAKLFQLHTICLNDPQITRIFVAFSSNPHYNSLFTGSNLTVLSKINRFAYDSLNTFMMKLISQFTSLAIENEVFFDYLVLKSFDHENLNSIISNSDLIELFLELELFVRKDDGKLVLKCNLERSKQTEKTMKLLTHQFLTAKLESLESKRDPIHLPWMIPDYACLVNNFGKIRKAVLAKKMKILITIAVLQELDAEKNKNSDCREVIRFLSERIDCNNPCIKLCPIDPSTEIFYPLQIDQLHIDICKRIAKEEYAGEDFKIICSNPLIYAQLMSEISVSHLSHNL